MQKNSSQNQSTTLFIQSLHQDVTKNLLFKQFKKFGTIESLKHFPKNRTALVEFQTPEEAQNAKQSLNYIKLLGKEINIINYQTKDELEQKKDYNLLIQNVPLDLETITLHNFMTKYGEISSLLLKKDQLNQNLGDGFIQFETKEACDKILKEHEQNGKISLPNSNISFNIQKNNQIKQKNTKIMIYGLFEHEIAADQKESKTQSINAIFEEIKKDLQVDFNFYTEYNEKKKNFWAKVDFTYDDDQQKEEICKIIIEQVQKNFHYSGDQSKGPKIVS
ncbi:hypothetical protein TTHERM_00691350 (macronuclear) [Tetrahymena thermophila SB210]|uniref:RRM domain-containing protein n=1 Tax=Tetrahymena thermophila (strain SB210) TaxID=312017 RepID=I7MCN6_TETTS|nr:hypothetical protein TTHERM_00691350 [Tetrahymena thermophila SB210]EAR84437.1 hypothetical protein TTHERM_00691350 [Tetrahymena thermophila SB210]|eukprot:XP_001032100.1 hypothetical protein TTHERM_00691350 [Tetrahymena thermophila SB210]